jgi:hypothetical protein
MRKSDKIYSCGKGHQWTGNAIFKGVGVQIIMPDGSVLTIGSLCPYCTVNWLKENIAPAVETQQQ